MHIWIQKASRHGHLQSMFMFQLKSKILCYLDHLVQHKSISFGPELFSRNKLLNILKFQQSRFYHSCNISFKTYSICKSPNTVTSFLTGHYCYQILWVWAIRCNCQVSWIHCAIATKASSTLVLTYDLYLDIFAFGLGIYKRFHYLNSTHIGSGL